MKRRQFLTNVGFASLGLGLSSFSRNLNLNAHAPFGIQLWTIKDIISEDPKAALTYLSSIGYKQIESFEGPQGIFWGMSPKEFKMLMDDLGMKIISAHCDPTKNLDEKAHQAASIGMDYLICPYVGPRKTADEFKKIAEDLNNSATICQKAGIRFGYHNHDYSFLEVDGQTPMDIFMKGTDPKNFDFELDMYWAEYAGVDPLKYFMKHSSRIRLAHIKDLWQKDSKRESCNLGEGIINYKDILPEARKHGLKYCIVEQEAFTKSPVKDAVKIDADFMKTL